MNHKQWRGWWRNNEYTKKSGDQLKSNMEWSHINNEHNDGNDNDPESLREDHSSHSLTKDVTSEHKEKRISESTHMNSHQQTYSIKWPSNIYIHAQWWRILCKYTHVLIFLIFSFFSFSFFSFFIFYFILFLHIYKCTCPEHKQNKLQIWYQ